MIAEENYIKLKINGILDLDVISEEYHIPKKQLVDFHNSHCEVSEILPLHLSKYIPYIYIPKDRFERKRVQLLTDNVLHRPSGKSEKRYGIIIKYPNSNLQIHFEVDVAREADQVEIIKRKSYVNNEEVVNIVERIFETAEQTLYPLQLSLNGDGSFSTIENVKIIADRWQNDVLPKLKEYYVGSTSEEVLTKIDLIFKNLNYKKYFFLQSVFYKIFFLPVYYTYSDFKKESSITFYFAKLQKYISYDLQYILDREFTRGNKIALQIAGKEQDDSFFDKTEKGEIDMMFKFQKNTHELFSVTGSASTFNKGKELKIEFQLFDISDLS